MEAEADWDHLRTPETYLGYGRGEHFASPDGAAFDERRAYELPERLRLNHWALAGEWTVGREKVVLDQRRRQHRLPVPRARRAPGAVVRSAGADPLPRAPRRRGSGPVARRGRRRGRERRAPGRPPVPARARARRRSASGRWRSRSSSPAPRRTRSRSASRRGASSPALSFQTRLPLHVAFARLAHALSQRGPVGLGSVSDHGCPGQPGFPGQPSRSGGGADVRHTRRVTRAIVGLLAAFVSFAVLACGVAAAVVTNFEAPLFLPGSVNGQGGRSTAQPWKSAPLGAIPACVPTPTNGQYDQAVVANLLSPSVGFGPQSLRMSNACASGEFFNQTYSSRVLTSGRGAGQQGVHRPVLVHLQDARSPAARTLLERQPGLVRGLAHVLGGSGGYSGWYPGHRLR